MGLEIIDIKNEKGGRVSWKLHRGNLERTGEMGLVLLSNDTLHKPTPSKFYVSSGYPNPFNPSIIIDIQTVVEDRLVVSVFNALGRKINVLENKNVVPGNYQIKWSGKDFKGTSVSTGIYFLSVQSGKHLSNQKILLIK